MRVPETETHSKRVWANDIENSRRVASTTVPKAPIRLAATLPLQPGNIEAALDESLAGEECTL